MWYTYYLRSTSQTRVIFNPITDLLGLKLGVNSTENKASRWQTKRPCAPLGVKQECDNRLIDKLNSPLQGQPYY